MGASILDYYQPEPTDVSALWVLEGCSSQNKRSLAAVLPSTFERYVRLFPPGWQIDAIDSNDLEELAAFQAGRTRREPRPITWKDVARLNNRTPHRLMQWGKIAPQTQSDSTTAGIYPNGEGELPMGMVTTLFQVLIEHCGTNQSCLAGFWSGYRNMDSYSEAARFESSNGVQDHLLFKSTLGLIRDHWIATHERMLGGETAGLTPNNVWPTSRDWYLAVPYNLNSAYLGCNKKLADRILATRQLESDHAQISDDIWNDTVNT